MKKLILLFVLIGQAVFGQVSYNPSIVSGTYAPLGSKTVFQTGDQLNTDAVSQAITLPFAFTVYGKGETVLFISNNGFVTFGKAQTTVSTYSPISSTVTSGQFDNLISAFGNQLIAAQSGTPEISYGTNAAKDFVVQYQDVGVLGSVNARFTFQIVLKKDGTTIQIVWGPNCTGAETNARASQVGIRGKQSPRIMGGVEYATPETKIYTNLTLVNGDYNKMDDNIGVKRGTTNSAAMATRNLAGMNMTFARSGTTYQFNPQ